MSITRYEIEAAGLPDVERGVPPTDPGRWAWTGIRSRSLAAARRWAAALRRRHGCRTRIIACERSRVVGVVEERAAVRVQGLLWGNECWR